MRVKNKAISPIVAMSLLLLVGIVAFFLLNNWFLNFEADLIKDNDAILFPETLNFEFLDAQYLYVRNFNIFNVTVEDVLIDGSSCSVQDNITANNIHGIDLNTCLDTNPTGPKEVVLIADGLTLKKTMFVDEGFMTGFNVAFTLGSSCSLGYTRIYGLEYLIDAHVEVSSASNYTYSVCAKHLKYNIGNSCSGDYTRLLYLDKNSDAHGYNDTTSPYESDWHDVCLSADGASILDTVISSTRPGIEYECFGSMDALNNVNGAHMGDCRAYSTRLWVRVE